MYKHTCVYIYIYTYTYVYVYIYIYIYILDNKQINKYSGLVIS